MGRRLEEVILDGEMTSGGERRDGTAVGDEERRGDEVRESWERDERVMIEEEEE